MKLGRNPAPLLGLAIVVGACFDPQLPLEPGDESSGGSSAVGMTSTGRIDMSTGSTGGPLETGSTGTAVGTESSSGSAETDTGSTGGATTDPIVPDEDCDPWQQDCPLGYKCAPTVEGGGSSWNALTCVPLDPDPVQVGESCFAEALQLGLDNCALGSICWGVDPGTQEGHCVAQCMGSVGTPWCVGSTSCVVANEGVLNLCLPTCDPLLQDCPPGEGCYPVGEGLNCAPDASAGAALVGDPCESVNGCAPGSMCVPTDDLTSCDGAVGCCSPFCDTSAPLVRCPGATEQCVPLFDAPGFEPMGVCAVGL